MSLLSIYKALQIFLSNKKKKERTKVSRKLLLRKLISLRFQLESRLAQKEEQLLEKELVFEQINRLVVKVKNKSLSGKDNTLTFAKKVNECDFLIFVV